MEIFSNFEGDVNKKLFGFNYIYKDLNEIGPMFQASDECKNHFYFENFTDDYFYTHCGITDNFLLFYKKIIKSGVGQVITGGVNIGINQNKKTNLSRINLDWNIMEKYKEITKFAHSNFCKIFLKIKSVYGRFNNSHYGINDIKTGSNFGTDPENNKKILIRITDNKCNDMINDFSQTVLLSNIAGFDGVMIDCSLDNLIGELTSEEYNKRIFGYYSNCDDFLIKALKRIDGKNNTIILKINLLSLFVKEIKNANYCKIFKNFNEEQLIKRIINYIELGVDGFEFVFGTFENCFLNSFNQYEDEFLFYDLISKIKDYFNKNNIKNKWGKEILIYYHDNINNPVSMLNTIDIKNINYIDVTRNLLSDNNYLKNLILKIPYQKCIKCSYCNKKAHFNNKIECVINPSLLYSDIKFEQNNKLKKVAIIGSGISGIICAITLIKRGFNVTIFEKNNELNLIGKLTTIFGFDKLLLDYFESLEKQLLNFKEKGKLIINLNEKFRPTNETLREFDSIIIATGFSTKFLTISGAVQSHVFDIYTFLKNKQLSNNKKNIVIYAKTELSLKLALYLSNNNKNITIIIKDVDYFIKQKNANLFYYFCNLYKNNVNIYFYSKITKINEDNIDVKICRNLDKNSINTFYNTIKNKKQNLSFVQMNLDCNLLIYEPDIKPNNKLYVDIVNKSYLGDLYLIGNALENTNLAEIIKSGYLVGKNL